ncbi:MAG: DUF1501 domain-containing protein [Deltaproteobacteria bacterium]|jgi:uncharacterized protein (DUF1501 family)
MTIDRRRFIQLSGLGLASLGLGAIPRRAFAADNDQVLLTVFLRGGADGMSLLHPQVGTPMRAVYETWRGNATRVANSIPIGGRLAMHPALAPLQTALDNRHLMLLGGVGGAAFNRSHFEQQDLVETGAGPAQTPRPTGVLGRALASLGRADGVLSGISLNATPPESIKQAGNPGLSMPDVRRFGALRSATHANDPDYDLAERMRRLYVPGNGMCNPGAVMCENGRRASSAIEDIASLRDTAGVPSRGKAANLGEVLTDVAQLVAADSANAFKFLTLDVGGWDTHLDQGNDAVSGSSFSGTLAGNLNRLAGALATFYGEARDLGVWNRMNVLVLTEFGRTTRQNGTGGTDHGFGGTALLMGSGLSRKIMAPGYFPNNTSAAFYGQAESENVLPRLIEHRHVFAEVLTERMGVDNLGSVLSGFSLDPAIPRFYG